MTLGDPTIAHMLLDHYGHNAHQAYSTQQPRAPKGFKRVGQGEYRVAVLDKTSDIVYKLGDSWANVTESENSRRLKKKSVRNLGFELIIPHTRTYLVNRERIAVQEFAKEASDTYCRSMAFGTTSPCSCGKRSKVCFSDIHERIMEWSGLGDVHSANVLMDKEARFWFIDMAD